jgi:hypothetical protein
MTEADLHELVARSASGDAVAGQKLAALVAAALSTPRKPVKSAFGLSRRGGESPRHRAARQRRNAALRALAASIGGDLGLPEIAERVARKLRRYEAACDRKSIRPETGERALLFSALQPGLPIPGRRQMQAILLNRRN